MKKEQLKSQSGQVVLMLVLAVTVAGTLVVSLASRSTRGLRTRELDVEGVKALKGAESGVEQALLNQETVTGGSVGAEGVGYDASFSREGGQGLVSIDEIQAGEVLEISLSGSDTTLTDVRIYFSSDELVALKISEYWFNSTTNEYSVSYLGVDGDASRIASNNLDDIVRTLGYVYKGVSFQDRVRVAVNTNTAVQPVTRTIRVKPLYGATKIGVEPLGGNLADQQTVVSSLGTYSASADQSVKKRIELRQENEGVPAVFDNVLYSNSALIQ